MNLGATLSNVNNFFWNIFHRIHVNDFLDIALVAFLIYKLLMLTKNTRASQVLKGFFLLVAANWVSMLLGFESLNWVLKNILNNGTLVLLILFQPEIRSTLEHLGRGTRIDRFQNKNSDTNIISEITHAVLNLARRRVGALIVFEKNTGLKEVIDTGTQINAHISSPLLVNIFEPNTPLHDGAVVIKDGRIEAAACLLTLSEQSSLSRDLGTRHRAGLGISETTDAIVLIVSEETGIISVAQGGKLTRHLDADGVNKILKTIFQDGSSSKINALYNTVRQKASAYIRRKKDAQQ